MKKLITSILLICAINSLFAQTIPNASFENWTFKNSKFYDPDGWGTLNPMTSPANLITCNKGTASPAPNAGISYLMLSSKSLSGQTLGAIAVSGTFDPLTEDFGGGFAINSKPSKLNGKWQYMAQGADQGAVAIILTKQNATTGMKDTIAMGGQLLQGMAMSWASFSIDINYFSNAMPDSCLIIFLASGGNPVAGSYLYIDDLSFSGNTSVSEISNFSSYDVYPNPVKEKLNLEINLKQNTLVQVEVMDIQGKQIKAQDFAMNKGENQVSIDLSDVQKGIYFVRMTADGESLSQKLVVE
ncbi:MAG: T9SS type A sorting domain-containing protein [Bacteroidetes bacterium]|nr:T9SS type A sorting domain-containing protein [Bacteroidota bacterium]